MKQKVIRAITMEQLRRNLGNSRVIRKFAEHHDLVYFGTVTTGDESRLVKGFTLSRTQYDEHYCVGTTYGRDMIFVQRTDTLKDTTVKSKKKESYTWNILAIDLQETARLPHVILEGSNRYGTAFSQALAIKHRELVDIPAHMMGGYDPRFVQHFRTKTSVIDAAMLPTTLTPLTAATLGHHFPSFDIEWQGDLLYMYYVARQPITEKLELMLKCGVWLADELEKSQT